MKISPEADIHKPQTIACMMTSLKQIDANRINARKSTGPRTEEGKQRSRQNAARHGLTAETVIASLENAGEYQVLEATVFAEHRPRSATERELTARLASVLWRLRRATRIETGLMQSQAELLRGRSARRATAQLPEWLDEMDVSAASDEQTLSGREMTSSAPAELAYCFLQVSRLQYGAFETVTRYETALWRQAAQLIFMLQSNRR